MYEQIEKTKENKNGAVANSVVQKKSNGKQGFGFVDNRPEGEAQKKQKEMISNNENSPCSSTKVIQNQLVTQLQESIMQRVKYSELSPEEQKHVSGGFNFVRFLKGKYSSQFGSMAPMAIKNAIIKENTDYPDLKVWIASYLDKGDSKESTTFDPFAASSTMAMKDDLPPTQNYKGTFVSFQTNVETGIDGFFDLWCYNKIDMLDVDVKFKLSKKDMQTQRILQSLEATEEFWNRNVMLKSEKYKKVIRVKINIIPTLGKHGFHYQYTDAGSANPNVLRANQQFTTRSVDQDKLKPQTSAFHEFGHTLGLGEEYDVANQTRNPLHHKHLLTEMGQKEFDSEVKGDDITTSIMGSKGMEISPRHYQPILIKYCQMNDYNPSDWLVAIS